MIEIDSCETEIKAESPNFLRESLHARTLSRANVKYTVCSIAAVDCITVA